nr:hypothetical protein [Tanacetum cinerariifolium]
NHILLTSCTLQVQGCQLQGLFWPTVLSFVSAEYTRDRDRANCLNTSACVASDIDCRSSCTNTQDLDRMPVETITVANQTLPGHALYLNQQSVFATNGSRKRLAA